MSEERTFNVFIFEGLAETDERKECVLRDATVKMLSGLDRKRTEEIIREWVKESARLFFIPRFLLVFGSDGILIAFITAYGFNVRTQVRKGEKWVEEIVTEFTDGLKEVSLDPQFT